MNEGAVMEAKGIAPDLDSLWRAAMSRPMHSPACGCAVPSAIRLDPAHVELDILDYAEDKRDLGRYPAWVAARAARGESAGVGFAAWLESVRVQQLLPASVWEQVMADVVHVLEGMASHAANRLAPVGTLEKGWLSGNE
jgi:hypothetical protein